MGDPAHQQHHSAECTLARAAVITKDGACVSIRTSHSMSLLLQSKKQQNSSGDATALTRFCSSQRILSADLSSRWHSLDSHLSWPDSTRVARRGN